MNYSRIVMAAVGAFLVDGLYGFLVYGTALTSEFAANPDVYRPAETQPAYLPMMFAGILVAMFVMAYIYARGYEGGSGVQEGMRFGVLIGLFNAGFFLSVNHATMKVGLRITGLMAIAGLVEWTIVGIVIGAIYKAAPVSTTSSRRVAGV
jgi:hypothetical protein